MNDASITTIAKSKETTPLGTELRMMSVDVNRDSRMVASAISGLEDRLSNAIASGLETSGDGDANDLKIKALLSFVTPKPGEQHIYSISTTGVTVSVNTDRFLAVVTLLLNNPRYHFSSMSQSAGGPTRYVQCVLTPKADLKQMLEARRGGNGIQVSFKPIASICTTTKFDLSVDEINECFIDEVATQMTKTLSVATRLYDTISVFRKLAFETISGEI